MLRRAARGILVVLTAVTVTAGLAAVIGEAAASAAGREAQPPPSSLTWHAPVRVDGTGPGNVEAVSCASPSYCASFDDAGYQATWHGSKWTAPVKVLPLGTNDGVRSASCPAAGFCVAAGGSLWVESGGTVTRFAPPASDLWIRVSCASSVFCVAGGLVGDVTMWNGHSWSAPLKLDKYALISVSCASAKFCVGLDFDGSVWTWNGTGWAMSDPSLVHFGNAVSVSCASAAFCMAHDDAGNMYKFNGSAWSRTRPTGLGVDQSLSLSCTSATFCVAVSDPGKAARYNGSKWSLWPRPVPGGGYVACSGSFCVVIGGDGYAATLKSGAWTPEVGVDAVGGLAAVACPATTFCVAAGIYGDVATYRGVFGAGGSWHAPVTLLALAELTSVSCPSARFCLLAGVAPVGGALRMWRYNGTRWSPAPVPVGGGTAGSVSCVSAAFCVWASPTGYISAFNGTKWTKPVRVDNDRYWTTVSCATTRFCVAGDDDGNVATYNGRAWSGLRAIGPSHGVVKHVGILSLSCASPRFCAVAFGVGVATFNGVKWVYAPASDDPALIAVSCTQGSFCAGLGSASSGTPAAFTFNGRQWSRPAGVFTTSPLAGPTSVSCATAKFCMATDDSGLALAGTQA